MTKGDVIWLGIRLAGLYCAVSALMALATLLPSALVLGNVTDPALRGPSLLQVATSASRFVLGGLAGLYLLFGGRGLYRLMVRRPAGEVS